MKTTLTPSMYCEDRPTRDGQLFYTDLQCLRTGAPLLLHQGRQVQPIVFERIVDPERFAYRTDAGVIVEQLSNVGATQFSTLGWHRLNWLELAPE